MIMVLLYPAIFVKCANTESMIKKFILFFLPFMLNLVLVYESFGLNEGEELQIYRAIEIGDILTRMFFIFIATVVGSMCTQVPEIRQDSW